VNLGVLDLGKRFDGCSANERVEHTMELAQLAERSGFVRYWLAEHHVPETSLAAPEIVLAVLAGATKRIKLGAGGVLLRYYSPLKVAEVYLTLQAAYPGRIELGVCRGPGAINDRVELALVSGNAEELTHDSYDAKVDDLFFLLDPTIKRPQWLDPRPADTPAPPLWVLGSGEASVRQAVRHSSRYGFMCFHPGSEILGPGLVNRYRDELAVQPASGPLITVSVICGETNEQARAKDDALVAGGALPGKVVGDVEQCTSKICELASAYAVRDVLVASFSTSMEDHVRMIEVLGDKLTDAAAPLSPPQNQKEADGPGAARAEAPVPGQE
jgi:luciferase family oxidoreductase group 1